MNFADTGPVTKGDLDRFRETLNRHFAEQAYAASKRHEQALLVIVGSLALATCVVLVNVVHSWWAYILVAAFTLLALGALWSASRINIRMPVAESVAAARAPEPDPETAPITRPDVPGTPIQDSRVPGVLPRRVPLSARRHGGSTKET